MYHLVTLSHHKGTVVLQQRASGGSDIYSFCENWDNILQNPLDLNLVSDLSLMLCQLNCWGNRCEQLFD